MPELQEATDEVKVIGPKGTFTYVSKYLAYSKDGQAALKAQNFRIASEVIPEVLIVERPPLVDEEKERLRAELEALKAQLAQANTPPADDPVAAHPPAEAAPVTPQDQPKRGPGRPHNSGK